MPPLPLSGLRAFEAASRCASFRQAAAELNLSPSAVSHAVRRLEHALGTPLFERQGRAARLSPAGEALMGHTARGFAELHRGLSQVATRGPQQLRLHCAPSFAAQWLLPRLPGLLSRHPALEIRLHADANYSSFTTDDYDADLIYGLPRVPGLEVALLAEERVVPLCAPAVAAALRHPADLTGCALVASDNKAVRWSDWYAANGVPALPRHNLRFDRSFLALAAAAAGLGVALESTLLAERELAAGVLVEPFPASAPCRDVGHRLVCRPGALRAGPVTVLKSWLAAELGRHHPAPGLVNPGLVNPGLAVTGGGAGVPGGNHRAAGP